MFLYVETRTSSEYEQAQVFGQYLLPTEPISRNASSATGLSVVVDQGRKQLAMHGKLVEACSQAEGLRRFLSWLENNATSVVLVAHNCLSFDMRVFLNAARREGLLEELQKRVDGFCDTLPIFKEAFSGQPSYSLSPLYAKRFGESFPAHDAAADVTALARLLQHANADIHASSVTLSSAMSCVAFGVQNAERVATFSPLVSRKALSKALAARAATSGLRYRHLLLAHRRDRDHGIENLLKGTHGGNRRVTESKQVIAAVAEYCNKHMPKE